MNITDYLKRKMALLSMALAKVEKEALNETSDGVGVGNSGMEQSFHEGRLADALLKGEITQSVKELRWRMYKVLNASENFNTRITGYNEETGLPITETTKDENQPLKKVKVDSEDPYEVELVVTNEDIIKSISEAFNNDKLKVHSEEEVEKFNKNNEMFNLVGDGYELNSFGDLVKIDEEKEKNRTLGQIKFDDMVSSMKSDKSIIVHRSFRPKFEIEQYTKKLVVRDIDGDTKLLEFYISKYPDEFDRKTRLLVSEIKKAIKNPRSSDILDIEKVGFVTYKALGTNDGMEYIYEIKNFHKIIEYDGHYIIKFMTKPIINGQFIYDTHKLEELEEKYLTKAPKDKDI